MMGVPVNDTESMIRCIANGLATDPDAHSAKERAAALMGGVALFLSERYGPHKAAENFYQIADVLACEPDDKEKRT